MPAAECWNPSREGSVRYLRTATTPQKLPSHDIKTTQEMGWDRLRNGDLIRVAEEVFDVVRVALGYQLAKR